MCKSAFLYCRSVIVVLFLFMLFLLPGCHSDRSEKPNLIFISIDSLRADHMGSYGYSKPTSPFMDELAKQGFLFKYNYAPSPWTLPSHVSMFTGLHPDAHKVDQSNSKLSDQATTLTEVLKENGYQTYAVICAPFLRKRYNLNQGFDVYDTDLVEKSRKKARLVKVAKDVTDKALKYIEEAKQQPYFLFLHYWDPHYDYNPPQSYVEIFDPDYEGTIDGLDIHGRKDLVPGMNQRDLQHLVALYDGEIRYTDDQIRRLFEKVLQGKNGKKTAVIITADHGEEFLEHGGTGHSTTCFEESIRIPLIIHAPWIQDKGKSFDNPVSLLDLMPTFLDLAGVHVENTILEGASLLELMKPGGTLPNRFLTASTLRGKLTPEDKRGRMEAILSPSRSKLQRYFRKDSKEPVKMLFDLNTDPDEKQNLSTKSPEKVQRLEVKLQEQNVAHKKLQNAYKLGQKEALSADLKKQLKNLGYIQ